MNPVFARPSILRAFMFYAATILAVSIIMSIIVIVQGYNGYSERVGQQLEAEATRIDRTLVLEIEHSAYLLQSLGRQILHYGPDRLDEIARLLRSFDPDATIHNVLTWTNTDQQVVVSSNRGVLDRAVDVSDRDYVKLSLKEPWTIHIGRPIQGRVSEKWVIPVTLGITDYTGRYVGSITISLDIPALSREIARSMRQEGIGFALSSRTFTVLTEQSDLPNFANTYFPLAQLRGIDFARDPSGMLGRGSMFGGDEIYSYYQRSANYPYLILLGMDPERGRQGAWNLVWPRLVEIGIVAGILLLVLWLIRSRVIQPVEELTDATAGMIRGEPYTPHGTSGPSEIEALRDNIARLGDYLNERKRIEEERIHKMYSLKRAKEYAELRDRIKLEFLGSMSRELREPLTTINGYAESIAQPQGGKLDEEKAQEYAGTILQAGRHLEQLVEDTLILAKAEASLTELRERPIDLGFVARKAVRLVAHQVQRAGVTIDLQLPDDLPRLKVDELRLKQILVQLLTGAVQRTAPGGVIVLQGRAVPGGEDAPEQRGITLIITDDGGNSRELPVLPDLESEHRLIRPFLRQGGLRLPLIRALAAMLDISLDIQQGSGKRTSTYLRFPASRVVQTGA